MAETTTRRRFLNVLATGTATLGAAALGVGCGSGEPTGVIAAGNVSAVKMPSLTIVTGQALALGRDENGLYAMSLICTHAGCDMADDGSVSESGVSCSCHGSMFSATGEVTRGPANSPLNHYEVTVDASGAISVDADKTVDASVRVAVSNGVA